MILLYFTIAIFVALQIADVDSTILALKLPGRREVNPVIRFFIKRSGSALPGLILVKLLLAPIVILSALMLPPIAAVLGIVVLDLFYVRIVQRNYRLARAYPANGSGSPAGATESRRPSA